jgi:hypothetical protein
MKNLPATLFLVLFWFLNATYSQYTEVINSNRPGVSMSAFAIGKSVLQGEFGINAERRKHDGLLTESGRFGIDFAFRYGLFFEQLEIIWDGSYAFENLTQNIFTPPREVSRSDFLQNTIGLKYLLYDPWKNQEERKPNLYSWKANNSFKWSNLIPAVAIYAGANIIFSDNPFLPNESSISPKIGIMAQSHFTQRWVLVSNIWFDKFTSDNSSLSYVLTVTHTLRNPKWSVFVENQGISGDFYADFILRAGSARLINKNFQVDASIGGSLKNTPSRLFGAIGVSYRLDYHKDELKRIDKGIKKVKLGKKKKVKKNRKKRNRKKKDPIFEETNE